MPGREGRRKPVPRQRSSFRTVAVLMLIPIAGLIFFLTVRFFRDEVKPQRWRAAALSGPKVATSTQGPLGAAALHKASPAPKAKPKRATTPRIVLILDDVGFDSQPLDRAMQVDPNLNFSILPNANRAADFAERLHARGFEILCHLPMEPLDYPRHEPGAGAVLTSMTDDEIVAATRNSISGVPHAVGVNNHMGSRATTDERVMSRVLETLPKGMYFIDSRTAPKSIAGRMARQMNIPTASRHIFLDDVQSERAIRRQLAQLAQAAEERGIAIGIGHIYPVTVKVLAEEVPQLRSRGFRFLRASEVVQ